MAKPLVMLGILGARMDRGGRPRWNKWRPSVDLFRHDDLVFDRCELLYEPKFEGLAKVVLEDIANVSPETSVHGHRFHLDDPWDFEEVFAALFDFARTYPFRPDEEDYLVHITTGTHVIQICLFLLTESRHLPARLLQCSPPRAGQDVGTHRVIDLDTARYDQLAARFAEENVRGVAFLKGGVATQNAAFNALVDELERVGGNSDAPILLTGPTGVGKTRLARRLHALKRLRHRLRGPLVELNCATLRGDGAMSALFGHRAGAFTGATTNRSGALREADGGVLFLDEIGELGRDEQAMLLRALEDKIFRPLGADDEVTSDFSLIAGTNQDLTRAAHEGRFRDDLLARIDLWHFELPALRARPEDIEPNLDFELARRQTRTTMNKAARERFLAFASRAPWPRNFRDLTASVERMSTLAEGGRIDDDVVREEIARLRAAWGTAREVRTDIDLFDALQLESVLEVCRQSESLADAGRKLFDRSRLQKKSANDSDRLRKYLARFGRRFEDVK